MAGFRGLGRITSFVLSAWLLTHPAIVQAVCGDGLLDGVCSDNGSPCNAGLDDIRGNADDDLSQCDNSPLLATCLLSETCDDGNAVAGDGCDSACQSECTPAVCNSNSDSEQWAGNNGSWPDGFSAGGWTVLNNTEFNGGSCHTNGTSTAVFSGDFTTQSGQMTFYVWILGFRHTLAGDHSFAVRIDGAPVGTFVGTPVAVRTLQWQMVGTKTLGAGPHTLELQGTASAAKWFDGYAITTSAALNPQTQWTPLNSYNLDSPALDYFVPGPPAATCCGDCIIQGIEQCDPGDNPQAYGGCDNTCALHTCGDGILDGPEQCDDGNLVNNDCCNAACEFEAAGTYCPQPQGIPVDGCDDQDTCDGAGICLPNLWPDGAPCGLTGECEAQDTCASGACVDAGLVAAGTPCGDPTDTACNDPDTCDASGNCLDNPAPAGITCRPAFPFILPCDIPEYCDGSSTECPPNLLEPEGTVDPDCIDDGDACTLDVCDDSGGCYIPATVICGDGNACGAEACDDGDVISNGEGFCLADCTGIQTCGDGIVNGTEECDDGNAVGGDCCDSLCQFESSGSPCGDLSSGACDNPDSCNGSGICLVNYKPSTTVCLAAVNSCDLDDYCDNSGQCSNINYQPAGAPYCPVPDGDSCTYDVCDGGLGCLHPVIEVCGDGMTCGVEVCDDGDTISNGPGSCVAECSGIQTCGDGIANGTEECDDAGESASCDSDCTAVVCGDLTVNASAGEACDDGFASSCGACNAVCTGPGMGPGLCGDGDFCPDAGEFCDEGAENGAADSCNGDCSAVCEGNFEWVVSEGTAQDDAGAGVSVMPGGNVVTSGVYGGVLGGTDAIISVRDGMTGTATGLGTITWPACQPDGVIQVLDVASDTLGDLYVVGSFSGRVIFESSGSCGGIYNSCDASIPPCELASSFPGAEEAFVAKIDSSTGDFLWARSIPSTSRSRAIGLAVDASSNVFITGDFQGEARFQCIAPGCTAICGQIDNQAPCTLYATSSALGLEDLFSAKLDINGNFLWAVGTGTSGFDSTTSIDLDFSGTPYIIGNYVVGVGPFAQDIFVARLDKDSGDILNSSLAGSGLGYDVGSDLFLTSYTQYGIHISGVFSGTAEFPSVYGGTISRTANGSTDVFIATLDPVSLVYYDVVTAGGSQGDYAGGISVDPLNGDYYVTGFFGGTAQFGPFSLTSAGGEDIFLAKISGATHQFLWAKSMGDSGADRGHRMDLDDSGKVYFTGYYSGSPSFDGTILANLGGSDIFTAKLGGPNAPFCRNCGDGNVDALAGEVCDDGNNANCDGCNYNCTRFDNICGDGYAECSEICDDGDTDDCTGFCNATCTGSAIYPICGNGIVECSEVCDDGFTTDCGACNADCTAAGSGSNCGDGILCLDNEQCDDGGFCRSSSQSNCAVGQAVGDSCGVPGQLGVCVQDTYQLDLICVDLADNTPACDATMLNDAFCATPNECHAISGDGCDACQYACVAFDGSIQPGEQCDDWNLDDADGCTATCRCTDPFGNLTDDCQALLASTCGNGMYDNLDEECDNGRDCLDLLSASVPDCSACLAPLECRRNDGNFYCIDPGLLVACDTTPGVCGGSETCVILSLDGCDENCQCDKPLCTCGDGVINAADEHCDDGGQPGGCPGDCTCGDACRNLCGDGMINSLFEECDDGNNNPMQGECDQFCRCLTPGCCGDGVINGGYDLMHGLEECDDGNAVGGDGCSASCTIEICGNGIVDPGEECDDGNEIADGNCCTADCLYSPSGSLCSNLDDGYSCTNEICNAFGECKHVEDGFFMNTDDIEVFSETDHKIVPRPKSIFDKRSNFTSDVVVDSSWSIYAPSASYFPAVELQHILSVNNSSNLVEQDMVRASYLEQPKASYICTNGNIKYNGCADASATTPNAGNTGNYCDGYGSSCLATSPYDSTLFDAAPSLISSSYPPALLLNKSIIMGTATDGNIQQRLAERGIALDIAQMADEEYLLDVRGCAGGASEILIAARTDRGVFHGMITLLHLMEPNGPGMVSVPGVTVRDYPDLEDRFTIRDFQNTNSYNGTGDLIYNGSSDAFTSYSAPVSTSGLYGNGNDYKYAMQKMDYYTSRKLSGFAHGRAEGFYFARNYLPAAFSPDTFKKMIHYASDRYLDFIPGLSGWGKYPYSFLRDEPHLIEGRYTQNEVFIRERHCGGTLAGADCTYDCYLCGSCSNCLPTPTPRSVGTDVQLYKPQIPVDTSQWRSVFQQKGDSALSNYGEVVWGADFEGWGNAAVDGCASYQLGANNRLCKTCVANDFSPAYDPFWSQCVLDPLNEPNDCNFHCIRERSWNQTTFQTSPANTALPLWEVKDDGTGTMNMAAYHGPTPLGANPQEVLDIRVPLRFLTAGVTGEAANLLVSPDALLSNYSWSVDVLFDSLLSGTSVTLLTSLFVTGDPAWNNSGSGFTVEKSLRQVDIVTNGITNEWRTVALDLSGVARAFQEVIASGVLGTATYADALERTHIFLTIRMSSGYVDNIKLHRIDGAMQNVIYDTSGAYPEDYIFSIKEAQSGYPLSKGSAWDWFYNCGSQAKLNGECDQGLAPTGTYCCDPANCDLNFCMSVTSPSCDGSKSCIRHPALNYKYNWSDDPSGKTRIGFMDVMTAPEAIKVSYDWFVSTRAYEDDLTATAGLSRFAQTYPADNLNLYASPCKRGAIAYYQAAVAAYLAPAFEWPSGKPKYFYSQMDEMRGGSPRDWACVRNIQPGDPLAGVDLNGNGFLDSGETFAHYLNVIREVSGGAGVVFEGDHFHPLQSGGQKRFLFMQPESGINLGATSRSIGWQNSGSMDYSERDNGPCDPSDDDPKCPDQKTPNFDAASTDSWAHPMPWIGHGLEGQERRGMKWMVEATDTIDPIYMIPFQNDSYVDTTSGWSDPYFFARRDEVEMSASHALSTWHDARPGKIRGLSMYPSFDGIAPVGLQTNNIDLFAGKTWNVPFEEIWFEDFDLTSGQYSNAWQGGQWSSLYSSANRDNAGDEYLIFAQANELKPKVGSVLLSSANSLMKLRNGHLIPISIAGKPLDSRSDQIDICVTLHVRRQSAPSFLQRSAWPTVSVEWLKSDESLLPNGGPVVLTAHCNCSDPNPGAYPDCNYKQGLYTDAIGYHYAAYRGEVPAAIVASDIAFMNLVVTRGTTDVRIDDLAIRFSTEDKDGDGTPNWKDPDDRDPKNP